MATVDAWLQLSGRLNLRVRRPSTGASDGGTVMFEFEGNSHRGTLLLQTVIGTTLARARWDADGAEIVTAQGRRTGATVDEVSAGLLGTPLPLAALMQWVRAQPWDGAPHTPRPDGFEQLGWQVLLGAWHERVVLAMRPAVAERPQELEITVRARLDDPADSINPATR